MRSRETGFYTSPHYRLKVGWSILPFYSTESHGELGKQMHACEKKGRRGPSRWKGRDRECSSIWIPSRLSRTLQAHYFNREAPISDVNITANKDTDREASANDSLSKPTK